MPERGWRKEWQLYYRPLEVVAGYGLLLFAGMRVVLHDPAWWSATRYDWLFGDSLFAEGITVTALFCGVYGLMPRSREMGHWRLAAHNVVRSIGAGILFAINALTAARSFEVHAAAPVAVWGAMFAVILLYDIWSE